MTQRVVFDAMVYLQAALNETGPSGACLQMVEQRSAVHLCVSPEIMDELQDVLFRDRLRKQFRKLTDELTLEFLDRIHQVSLYFGNVPRTFNYPRDPQDEPYLNLSIAANAEFLVTRDADLLSLEDVDHPDGQRLRRLAPQLHVLDPVAFLATIRSTKLD